MNLELKMKIYEKYGNQLNFSIVANEPDFTVSKVVGEKIGLSPERQAKWAELLDCKIKEIFSSVGKTKNSNSKQITAKQSAKQLKLALHSISVSTGLNPKIGHSIKDMDFEKAILLVQYISDEFKKEKPFAAAKHNKGQKGTYPHE
jgi:hypothetical protein